MRVCRVVWAEGGRFGLDMGKLYEDHEPLIYDMEVNVSKITFLESECTASV